MHITFNDVTYRYPDSGTERPALDSVTFELFGESRLIALLGSPGSGKSTLLQHLNGLLVPDEGHVQVGRFEIRPGMKRTPSDLRRSVGLVFQYPEQQLFEETVLQDLCFGPLNFGLTKEAALEAAHKAAAAMKLDESVLYASPFQLSSGQMRKAAIAAVLAVEPDVLVLDEPTASLDPASRREMMEMLHELCTNGGRSVVIVTHRLEEVLRHADEFLVLHEGRIAFQGDAEALLDSSDVLDAAGLEVPAAIRLARKFADRYEIRVPHGIRTAEDVAKWLAEEVLPR